MQYQANSRPATTEDSLADDILRGARAIGRYIGEDERAANHMCARGYIPCAKEAGQWIASKTALRQHYAKVIGASRANEAAAD